MQTDTIKTNAAFRVFISASLMMVFKFVLSTGGVTEMLQAGGGGCYGKLIGIIDIIRQ
jgi:hypothetical protein